MSYDLYIARTDECETCGRGWEGEGFNITWNLGHHFRKHIDQKNGIRWLYGKTGAQTTCRLMGAIKALKISDPTEDSARLVLIELLEATKRSPTGTWSGD